MTRLHATDHEIYRKRGATNIGLGLILGAIVLLIVAGTVAKLSDKTAEIEAVRAQEANQ